MPSIEMGGNFCLSKEQISRYGKVKCSYGDSLFEWKDILFTHGGRSAIIIAVRDLGLCNTKVLVPNFSCHSITDAFHACGCKVEYYKMNADLTANVNALMLRIDNIRPSILFTCPLFGFDTLANLRPLYKEIQCKGVKIIEDVTHSILGIKPYIEADRVVCSLRKWLEIPDGGFVWGLKDLDKEAFYQTTSEHKTIVSNFIKASKGKLKYFETKDDSLKSSFLPIFYKNNELFDDCNQIYRMSAFSYELLMQANFVANATTRNSNYRYLLQNINNQLIEVIQTELKEDTAPLYMQVYVKDGRRTDLQKKLMSERLYCPIIWPTPNEVLKSCSVEDIANYNNMLSLVIDQRYDLEDMKRLAKIINHFN